MRKVLIGLAAMGFVAALFWAYAHIMDTRSIESRNTARTDDLTMPESRDMERKGEGGDVIDARKAEYVVLDPETKELWRVFGFEKLLNSTSDASRRQVEKPYMIFYESDFQCRVEADMGIFQIDPSGGNPTPKDARLSGNVKILITPEPGSRISETRVEMDDLVFSSERSEFATDQKVHIRSEQVELIGTGLIVIFDSDKGRIDYLRIRDLERIRMQDLASPKSETVAAKAEPPTPQADTVAASGESTDHESNKQSSALRYYQCVLEDNVKIEYGNEIVVSGADQITIQNITFDQGLEAARDTETAKQKTDQTITPTEPLEKETQAEQKADSPTEVIVTCDGGIILEPMEERDAEQISVVQSVFSSKEPLLRTAEIVPGSHYAPVVEEISFAGEDSDGVTSDVSISPDLEVAADSNDSLPAVFEAREIDYDLLTGSGLAHGPVRFTFYQPPDPNSTDAKSQIPITVTADDNARFIADSTQTIKQVVFNGNVMTTRKSLKPDFVQLDKIHSEKLTIDLDENDTGSVDLSHLAVTEGRVFVESQRTQEDRELSKVKLYCTDISYDRVDNVIVAAGPGKIEMVNHENPQVPNSDPNNPLNRPSVAMVDGFTEIHWDIDKESIVIDGGQDQLELSYVPLVDGKAEKFIYVNAIRFDLSFVTDPNGKTAVKRVFTDKPIDYMEKDGNNEKVLHKITGGKLDYNADGWMKITGTPAMPCRVDGMRTQEVLVNPLTGEIDTTISTTPGLLKGG